MRPLRSPRPGRKPPGQPTFDDPTSLRLLDQFQAALRGLTPKTEEERLADANSAADDVVKITWRQIALGANTFSHLFLLIVQIWLGILFFSWGCSLRETQSSSAPCFYAPQRSPSRL